MVNLPDTIDRTPEYVKFIKDLKQFHDSKGTRLVAEPVLGGCRLDLYKIFRVVVAAGGFDEVTKNRGWKQVGNLFDLRSTCTNSAYILKGVYIRNLLGYEEEKVWNKTWNPPAELLGPHAHRASTLAGKAYRQTERKTRPKIKKPTTNTDTSAIINTIVNNHVTEKDRILFALQFGRESDVEWALNMIVQKSFECPEKIELNQTPLLLDIFISMAETGLMHLATAYHAERLNSNILDIMSNDHGHHSNNGELGTVLKVLHILRNLSSVKEYTQILAHNRSVNNVILQSLEVAIMMGHVEIGRHSIDILENIAPNIHLISKEDPFLVSLYKLVSSHDRYLVIGSIRTLSWLSVRPTNHACLINSPVLEPIVRLLMADDEELVGTVVEYTLQYAKMSSESRLTPYQVKVLFCAICSARK
ncbi:hypothetical protein RMCBS344292_19393 [Rhizopus microsporus]|nr:hypothetical protein RMCBS344292_19393 [Rhizopus microsporus]